MNIHSKELKHVGPFCLTFLQIGEQNANSSLTLEHGWYKLHKNSFGYQSEKPLLVVNDPLIAMHNVRDTRKFVLKKMEKL